jgi:PEGA domain-containing protein
VQRRLVWGIALLLAPARALARGDVAIVSVEAGAATGGEANAAGEAAIAIATDHVGTRTGRGVVRLDGVSDRAKACTNAACLAGLAPPGTEFVLVVTVSRERANRPLSTRFVLVLVKDPIETSMEVARAECDVGLGPQDWRPLLEPTLGPKLDPIEVLPEATGRLLVTANVHDAEVLVDGAFAGRTPMPVLPTVPAGRREVTVRAPRYHDFVAQVEVMEDQETRVDATLERIPEEEKKPIYLQPVAWIVAGGVVVAGAVVTALALSGGDENPHPNAVVVPPLR